MTGDRLIDRVEWREGHRPGCPGDHGDTTCVRPKTEAEVVDQLLRPAVLAMRDRILDGLAVAISPGRREEWEADSVVPSSFPSFEELRRPERLGREILAARAAAHVKHGDNSIEGIDAGDPRWLSILVEEVGEVAHALTYDAIDADLEGELVDVLAVASAWLDAVRRARVVSSDETGRSL